MDAKLNDYAEAFETGAVFSRAVASHYSRSGYMPAITPAQYGAMIERIGRMAQTGDRMAFLASKIVSRINLYGDRAQACISVFSALEVEFQSPFYDVVRHTGPEAGRKSDHTHTWSLSTKLVAYAWAQVITQDLAGSVPGYGWALVELARFEGVTLPRF